MVTLVAENGSSGGLRNVQSVQMHRGPPFLGGPPTSITLNFSEDLFFFFFLWRPPEFGRKKGLNFRFRAEKSLLISVKTFFFFGDHLILGNKKGLNVRFRPKSHSQFR